MCRRVEVKGVRRGKYQGKKMETEIGRKDGRSI